MPGKTLPAGLYSGIFPTEEYISDVFPRLKALGGKVRKTAEYDGGLFGTDETWFVVEFPSDIYASDSFALELKRLPANESQLTWNPVKAGDKVQEEPSLVHTVTETIEDVKEASERVGTVFKVAALVGGLGLVGLLLWKAAK